MRGLTSSLATAIMLTTLALGKPALAQTTGLEDMVGARAGQAENELGRRGYVNTGASQSDDRSYTNWWSADRRQCVTIATMNGRYVSVQPTTAPDCGMPSNMRPRPTYGNAPATRPRPGYEPDRAYGRPPSRPDYDRGDDRPPLVGDRSVDLGLVCFGDGSRTGLASGTTWTWNRDRDRYEYGRYNETRREDFDTTLTIQTWAGGGRIRLPRSLIPPINSRGDSGWWDLYDVSIGPDTIQGTYRLNGLNKPRVVIDRRSGRITVKGAYDYGFRGTCDLVDHGSRRF